MDRMLEMFGVGAENMKFVRKESIFNQFYSDLVTPLEDGISVSGTTVHIFYAVKMGTQYEARYLQHFKSSDIRDLLYCVVLCQHINELPLFSGTAFRQNQSPIDLHVSASPLLRVRSAAWRSCPADSADSRQCVRSCKKYPMRPYLRFLLFLRIEIGFPESCNLCVRERTGRLLRIVQTEIVDQSFLVPPVLLDLDPAL